MSGLTVYLSYVWYSGWFFVSPANDGAEIKRKWGWGRVMGSAIFCTSQILAWYEHSSNYFYGNKYGGLYFFLKVSLMWSSRWYLSTTASWLGLAWCIFFLIVLLQNGPNALKNSPYFVYIFVDKYCTVIHYCWFQCKKYFHILRVILPTVFKSFDLLNCIR